MESALPELEAQQAAEMEAAREEQQAAAQYTERAPLIPFQTSPPGNRPHTQLRAGDGPPPPPQL